MPDPMTRTPDPAAPAVEVVARAICPVFYGTTWEQTSEFRRGACMDMARAGVTALLPDHGWQDISTAPRDDSPVTLFKRWNEGEWHVGEGYFDTFAQAWSWADGRMTTPSHWRPLPSPPASGRTP
jgi:hypothetical protein